VYKLALLLGVACAAWSQDASNVLVVVNRESPLSERIGEYYALRRHIPAANICKLSVNPDEEIPRELFEHQIADPIAAFLRAKHLEERILYIVTTAGVPLRIPGHGAATNSEIASVDSELSLLYRDMHVGPHPSPSGIANPFFGKVNAPFRHPDFPIYLVTRLAGYDFADVKGIIDRALLARNRGMFVIDLKDADTTPGNKWLLEAAQALPQDRVVLDRSSTVLYNLTDVIGYASWGSNDPARKQRHLGFQWLPGAIMTEYVSTNGRTFARPPDTWVLRRKPAKSHRRLYSRRRHRRIGTRRRAVSAPLPTAQYTAARLLSRPQSGRKLLSGDSRAELDEHRHRRSSLRARKAVSIGTKLVIE